MKGGGDFHTSGDRRGRHRRPFVSGHCGRTRTAGRASGRTDLVRRDGARDRGACCAPRRVSLDVIRSAGLKGKSRPPRTRARAGAHGPDRLLRHHLGAASAHGDRRRGYSSGPVVLARRFAACDDVLEQNAAPGLTNRLLRPSCGRPRVVRIDRGGFSARRRFSAVTRSAGVSAGGRTTSGVGGE